MGERGCPAVGFDLGTTYSALAYMDTHGVPRIVPDNSGQVVVPSVIYFAGPDPVVGELAVQQSREDGRRVVQFVKNHMGEPWKFEIDGQVHTPESLSAMILAHLIREGEPQIGPIRNAVITVPAFFTEKRRRATQQAGVIAGLNVIGTLNEPMAAALAYGLHRVEREQFVLVYDLGGGTFDVTVVRISPREMEELATNGNRQLGGKDWDDRLIELALEDFQARHRIDLRQRGNEPAIVQAHQDLRVECEKAKRRLSQMQKTAVAFHALGVDHRFELTRQQFEDATAHLVQTTRLTTEQAIDDAGLRWDQVARAVLVGGSTLMPMVRQMLRDVSGKPPDVGINPVTAVALGAAVYAQVLETENGPRVLDRVEGEIAPDIVPELLPAGGAPVAPGVAPDVDVSFVTAHGVGIKALRNGRWTNAVLIPKNQKVPARVTQRFYTQSRKGRQANRVRIYVTQGDTSDPDLAEGLGTATITGIPRDDPPGQPVEITLAFDRQGRLQLHAEYVNTRQKLALTLEVPGCLCEADVVRYRQHFEESGLIPERERPAPYDLPEDDEDDDLPLLEPVP